MSKLSIWRNSPMFRLGLALALGLALLIGLLLVMGATHTPEVVLAQGPTTRYVASAPTGNDSGNDCTNSITPCATIGYALDQAGDGDAILVARGTYTENLFITKTVTLEGAYEPVGWSRCLRRCTTTIDGNRSGWVINVQSTLSETLVIDGFTITNGDGGIFIRSLSSVAIQNCKIVHNHRDGWGSGGITADRSYVAITNTLIARNTVTGSYAAMVVLSTPVDPWVESVVRIHNSTIVSNSATGFNGIMCSLSWCVFVNTIVWDHEGEVFDGNPPRYVVTYSDIEGGWPGEGNISEDPRFVDPASGDYHLRSDSPCIDAGTSEGAPGTDFEGDPRPIGTGYDMGADEYYYPALDVTKWADPDPVQAGAPLTYTLRVTNTGNVTLTTTITDILPNQVTPTGVLTWTPVTITAPDGTWMQQVVVTVEKGYAGPLTNVVQVTTEEGATGTDSVTVSASCYKIYLPAVLKNH